MGRWMAEGRIPGCNRTRGTAVGSSRAISRVGRKRGRKTSLYSSYHFLPVYAHIPPMHRRVQDGRLKETHALLFSCTSSYSDYYGLQALWLPQEAAFSFSVPPASIWKLGFLQE